MPLTVDDLERIDIKYTEIRDGRICLKKPCPFLKDNKCSIHNIRPEVCRIYPLAEILVDGKRTNQYIMYKGCPGCNTEMEVNADEWVKESMKTRRR